MPAAEGNQLVSVYPNDLKFLFELDKQSFCDLKVVNNTENYVAFKVKTTSPKKYFVQPNTGVLQPWDSCLIQDMLCKDKFLLQSTTVPPNTNVDDLPANTFNKDGSKDIRECKLKVCYTFPSAQGDSGYEGFKSFPDQGPDSNSSLHQVKEERDAAVRQTLHLQQELDFLKRRRQRRNDPGFSIKFAAIVGGVGIIVGLVFKL